VQTLVSFTIDDPIEDSLVEVTVTLSDGERRWCTFVIPQHLETCGELVAGTESRPAGGPKRPVRFHYGNQHMIIASELSLPLIEVMLFEIDRQGELEACTQPLSTTDDGDE
jgi:hypothetical protein